MSQGFAREARIGVDLHVGETLYYTSNDSFEKADYPGLYGVRVKVQGGGGGGGAAGSTTSSQVSCGGGGGGGSYAESIILAADLSTSETVTVGSGGSGGTGNGGDGSSGAASSFGSHATTNGGGGANGRAGSTNSRAPAGGNGGAAGTGDLTIAGAHGRSGMGVVVTNACALGGNGGGSIFGDGGRGRGTANNDHGGGGGSSGDAHGAGGGGAANRNSVGSNNSGGNGADGIVIVEVLYERKIAVDEDIHTQYLNDTRHNNAHSGMRAERATSNQTLANNTDVQVVYNSVIREDDADGDFSLDTGTGLVTVANAGWYFISAGANFATDTTNVRSIIIEIDNADQAYNRQNASTTGATRMTVAGVFYVGAGETVNVDVFQNSGGNLDLIASPYTFFSIAKVSG